MAAFLVMLREGVEAALVVAILLAYLDRIGRRDSSRWVWGGTLSAAAISLLLGVVLWTTIGGLEGAAEELAEGIVAVVAASLLTWMIFWMARQAKGMRTELHSKVDLALGAGGATALGLVAFVAVLREGVESALFMISTTVGAGSEGSQVAGGLIGLAAAVAIGALFYQGRRLVDLRLFFRVTGALIVLFAAGLVAKGIHELQEVGIVPTIVEHVWSTGFLDPATSTVGEFLSSLFGWDPDPSLFMVVGWLAYLAPIGAAFLFLTRAVRPAPAPIARS